MSDLFDNQPDPEDWSFEKIRLSEPKRADALEKAPKFLEIVDTVAGAAARAVRAGSDTYFWASEPHSSWRQFKRAVFQFPVEADQFDFFWNARTGFRAQFWLSAEIGARANTLLTKQVTAALPPEQRIGSDGWTLFDSEMSKCWFAETIKKFNRDVLIAYWAVAPEIVVARWNDVRALRPPVGEIGWLEIKGQYECETEGRYHPDTWALMTPGPNRRAELIHQSGFQ